MRSPVILRANDLLCAPILLPSSGQDSDRVLATNALDRVDIVLKSAFAGEEPEAADVDPESFAFALLGFASAACRDLYWSVSDLSCLRPSDQRSSG